MTKDDFLDAEALALLTGYRRPGKQVERLRQAGIAFFVNAAGRPVVPRSAIEGKNKTSEPSWKPKWAA